MANTFLYCCCIVMMCTISSAQQTFIISNPGRLGRNTLGRRVILRPSRSNILIRNTPVVSRVNVLGGGVNGIQLGGLGLNSIPVNQLGAGSLGVTQLGVNGFGAVNQITGNGVGGFNPLGVSGLGVNGIGLNQVGINGLGMNVGVAGQNPVILSGDLAESQMKFNRKVNKAYLEAMGLNL